MSKLIMWNIISLDGCFEGHKAWDLEFHNSAWDESLEKLSLEQLNSADGLIFGRKTFEGMAAYWKTATTEVARLMNNLPKIVCSKTLTTADWNNTRILSTNVSREIARVKSEAKKDLYVLGSANLSTTLINDDLIDEYRLAIAPVILGSGRSLFINGLPERKLSLLSSEGLKSGGVLLKYKALR